MEKRTRARAILGTRQPVRGKMGRASSGTALCTRKHACVTRAASAIRENTRKEHALAETVSAIACGAGPRPGTRPAGRPRPTRAAGRRQEVAGSGRDPDRAACTHACTAGPRTTARTPRHRYRMRRWTRSSHQTKPTFGGTDDWNPIPTTHSRCHSGRRSKTHILKLSIKPPTAMQKAPVRTSSSESFGSFILRRATRTDARVRSSGYKQAHEKARV